MNRRESLMLLAAAGSASAGAAASREIVGSTIDPLLTHIRIRGHRDGRLVYYGYEGTFYGQRSGQRTVPLLHIEGASAGAFVRQSDNSWLYNLREAGWMCDLASGAVLSSWINPLNGKTLTPRHYKSRQSSLFTGSSVKPVSADLPAGLEMQGNITRPVIIRDDIWTAEELLVRVPPNQAGGAAVVQTSLATLHANLRDLQRGADAWVPATLAYQTLQSWPAWMEMATEMPGVISWRLMGRKCASVDELPNQVRARIQEQHPEVFKW